MVDKALITQLQSLNAAQRKDAIVALGRTKDRDAIPHLTLVAENDPEDELRDLARKAAIFIDKSSPAVNVRPFTTPWDDEEPEDEADVQPISPAAALLPDYDQPTALDAADKENREWAERFIELAWQAHFTDDREAAEIYMRKALERFPVIAETESARDAASKIMNMTPDRAIGALLKPQTTRRMSGDTNAVRKSTGSIPQSTGSLPKAATGATAVTASPSLVRRPKEPKTADEIEDGSFLTLLFDLLIFFLVVSALEFVSALLANGIMLEALTSSRAPNDPFTVVLRDVFTELSSATTVELVGYSLLAGVQWLIFFVLISFLTHIVASSLFEGNSTLPRLIRHTYLAYAAVFAGVSTILAVTLYIVFTPNNPSPWQTGFAVSSLLGAFLIAWRIGIAYRFDFARGCFTIILTSVALLCCSLTVSLALIAGNVGPFAGFAELLSRR